MGNYVIKVLIYISIWIIYFINKHLSDRFKILLIKYSTTIIVLNVINNIYIYEKFPELRATGVLSNTSYLLMRGIKSLGNTSFSYLILFMAIFYLFMSLKKLNENRRNSVLLFLFFSFYIIRYTGSATIFLSLALSIFGIIMCQKNIKIRTSLILIVSVFIIIFIIISMNNSNMHILNTLKSYIGEKIVNRLLEIFNLLSEKKKINMSYFIRFNFIKQDLKLWISSIKNFLYGNGYHTYSGTSMIDAIKKTGDGGHSTFFDYITRYGVIGLYIEGSILKRIITYRRRLKNKILCRLFIILVIIFIINIILNNILAINIIFAIGLFFSTIFIVRN